MSFNWNVRNIYILHFCHYNKIAKIFIFGFISCIFMTSSTLSYLKISVLQVKTTSKTIKLLSIIYYNHISWYSSFHIRWNRLGLGCNKSINFSNMLYRPHDSGDFLFRQFQFWSPKQILPVLNYLILSWSTAKDICSK